MSQTSSTLKVQSADIVAVIPAHNESATHVDVVTPREILRANNHFERWVLDHLRELPLPLWRRVLLAQGCTTGLVLGVRIEWSYRRRNRRRDG